MAVETCSKGVSDLAGRYGKSTCFLRCGLSMLVDVGYLWSLSSCVNVANVLECALWYGS